MLAMAKASQQKKVMKGPAIDIDVDKLISGVIGGADGSKKKKGGAGLFGGDILEGDDPEKKNDVDDDDGPGVRTGNMGQHASKRAALKEDTVDELLNEYAADPRAKTKVAKKVVKRYPLYALRKAFGCAHVDLHVAVLEGNLPLVRKTLRRLQKKCPDSVNEQDAKGRTALSLAVKEGREDIVDLILSSQDSNPDLRDKWTGLAPLHHAAHLGLTNTVTKLMYRHCEVDIPDNNGTTALMMACAIGNEKMVNLLIDEKADPEKKDNYGWNALFYAAYGGSVQCTQKILNEGVPKKLKDKKKKMAIEWAEFMGHGNCVALLEIFTIAMTTDKYKGAMG